jgi:hypothetical protein
MKREVNDDYHSLQDILFNDPRNAQHAQHYVFLISSPLRRYTVPFANRTKRTKGQKDKWFLKKDQ